MKAPEEEIVEEWDPNQPKWFHSLQISLYVRDAINLSEEREKEL